MKTELIEIEGRSSDVVITTQERIDGSKSEICEMDIYFTGEHGIEQRAYLNLFLAAPELLEALRSSVKARIVLMQRAGFSEQDIADCTAQSRNAIAKATGDQA